MRRRDALGQAHSVGQLGQLVVAHAVPERRKLQRLFVFGVFLHRGLQMNQGLAELRDTRLELLDLAEKGVAELVASQNAAVA